MIEIVPIEGVAEVQPGDDLAQLLLDAFANGFRQDDIVVITQKVISKAEGRLVPEPLDAESKRRLVAQESRRVLRRAGEMDIAETHHGFVCANAGIDASNVPDGAVALLPMDPDASARRIRAKLEHHTGVRLGVAISDTFGRAWRIGQTDVAIGVAGFDPFLDHTGRPDAGGRILNVTNICIADEIAGAAELVMGKAENVCAAVVRGAPVEWGRGAARTIVRPSDGDLFR